MNALVIATDVLYKVLSIKRFNTFWLWLETSTFFVFQSALVTDIIKVESLIVVPLIF